MSFKKIALLTFYSILFFLPSKQAVAWEHEIAAGYGYGKEIGQNYDNHGIEISGKFYKYKIDNTLFATLGGTVASWHADTGHNKTLNTAALSAALRAYFAKPELHTVRPYLGASIGPAYLSAKALGTQTQGSNMALQITFEGGIEINNIDVNLHLAHYCNGGLFAPNEAINIPFVFSIGYLF